MAKFETIVRPVVFPDIRPARARAISPQDDPEQGFAVIRGASGKVVDLPYSFSQNMSESRRTELKRRVDEVRVSQKGNKKNFVDLQVANKIWFTDQGTGPETSGPAKIITNEFYKKVEEAENIEILEENKIIENPDAV